MARIFFLFTIIYFTALPVMNGQKLLEVRQWSKYFESNDNLYIDTDEDQNLYVAGTNTKVFDFDFGPATVNSSPNGAYFAKYDKNFNLLFYHSYEVNAKFTEIDIKSDVIYLAITYGDNAVVETIDQKTGQRFSLFSFSASNSVKIYSIAKDSKGIYYFAGAVGGFCKIYGVEANQIGSGENGILIRFDPKFNGKFWVRRFTNWGYPGDNKDIDANIVFLNSDNEIVTIGNSVIATYVYEQKSIENQNSAGFIAKCDSTGNFNFLKPAYYVTNEAGTKVGLEELKGIKFLYDRYGIGKLNANLNVNYLKFPFQSGNGFGINPQLVFDKKSMFFSGSGLTVEIANEKLRNLNNQIYHHIVGEMDEKLSLIWYQHMLPYTRIFETKMLPWGEDKILFTGLFIYDTDVDPSLDGVVKLKSSNGNRFFAIYDVSCRRLNLNITEIKDISCEDSTGQIKVIATSPFGNVNLFHNDESLAQGQTNIPVASPGIHKISAQDSFCTQVREVYVHGPEKGPAKPGISLFPGGTRAGMEYYLIIDIYNLSCTPQNGKLKLEIPKFYNFVAASLPYTILPNGQFEFDIQVVVFNKDSRLLIKYRIDGTAPGGEQVCWKTYYVDSENEIISQFLCQTITNSFDPNDLHVFPGGRCEENYILNDEKIEYLINFQNLGNDSAFHVSILDTLDGHLDKASFYLLDASHKVSVSFYDSILRFDFKDINLQAKVVNEQKSKGFVRFLIDQKPGIPAGTKYENRAHIFFDFNKAVTTNDVFNTLVDELPSCIISSIEPFDGDTKYSIFPNPTYDQILIKNLSGLSLVSCYNDKGNLVYRCQAADLTMIPVSHWQEGMYLISVKESTGKVTTHKMLVVRN